MQEKEDKIINSAYSYFILGKGYKLTPVEGKRHVYTTDKGNTIAFMASPLTFYALKQSSLTDYKDISDYIVMIAPYTPVTHEELVVFATPGLVNFFKGKRPRKVEIFGENYLEINYQNVCDISDFMTTLRPN